METNNKKPNVLFIMSDQHNAKVLGCNSHPNVKTPNLDQMAQEGVLFDRAITQNPICTPSRVSFLSGQYCHNHGYYGLEGENPGGLPNIISHFRSSGYFTSAIGKIHCPEYWVEDDSDIFHEVCLPCSVGGQSEEFAGFLKERGKYELHDNECFPEFRPAKTYKMDSRPSPLTFEESAEGWIASRTIAAMEQARSEEKPFFAFASFPRPHQVTNPSEPFWSMYEGVELELPPNADAPMDGRAPHMAKTAEMWRKGEWALFEPKTFEAARLRKLRGYLGAISQVDHGVGRLMDYLRKNGLEENTIVVYSTDHGDYACEHSIMEKAPGICSDAITRIPMIWKWKGHFDAGCRSNQLVEAVDVATTLCDLCGLNEMETSDGKSLAQLLGGTDKKIRELAVTEFAWSKSIYKDNYRFVYYPKAMFPKEYPDGFGELYDMAADPWELKNLYFDPEYAGIIQDIKNEYIEWLTATTRVRTVHPAPPSECFDGRQARFRFDNTANRDGKINPALILKSKNKNCNYI